LNIPRKKGQTWGEQRGERNRVGASPKFGYMFQKETAEREFIWDGNRRGRYARHNLSQGEPMNGKEGRGEKEQWFDNEIGGGFARNLFKQSRNWDID